MHVFVKQVVAKATLSVVLGICSSQLFAVDSSGTAVGTAYSVDAKLLYTETHQWHGVVHTVKYFRPDGEPMAVNQLDSSSSFVSPSYTQTYSHSDFTEGARWRGSELLLFSGGKEKAVTFKTPLVMSSGFYHFILDHWSELHSGQPLVFDFAVPSHLTTVRLKMQVLPNGAAAIRQGSVVREDIDPRWFYVRVEAANRLLGWLVKPVTAALDDRQRLRLYRGASNVRDEHGETPQVLIHYSYPASAPGNDAPAAPTAAEVKQ